MDTSRTRTLLPFALCVAMAVCAPACLFTATGPDADGDMGSGDMSSGSTTNNTSVNNTSRNNTSVTNNTTGTTACPERGCVSRCDVDEDGREYYVTCALDPDTGCMDREVAELCDFEEICDEVEGCVDVEFCDEIDGCADAECRNPCDTRDENVTQCVGDDENAQVELCTFDEDKGCTEWQFVESCLLGCSDDPSEFGECAPVPEACPDTPECAPGSYECLTEPSDGNPPQLAVCRRGEDGCYSVDADMPPPSCTPEDTKLELPKSYGCTQDGSARLLCPSIAARLCSPPTTLDCPPDTVCVLSDVTGISRCVEDI